MLRVIVTGGAGFIGSAVCRHLVTEAKCQVLNVDKLTYAGNLGSLDVIASNPLYEFLKADICDFNALVEAFDRFRARRRDASRGRKSCRSLYHRRG